MGSVPEATITLGEAASRLGTTVDALLELIYEGSSLQRQTRLRGGCP